MTNNGEDLRDTDLVDNVQEVIVDIVGRRKVVIALGGTTGTLMRSGSMLDAADDVLADNGKFLSKLRESEVS